MATGRSHGSATRRRNEYVRIREIADIAREGDDRFLCVPEPGIDPESVRKALLDFDGITTAIQAALPRPLPDLMRGWVGAYQDEGVLSSLASLEDAVHGQAS